MHAWSGAWARGRRAHLAPIPRLLAVVPTLPLGVQRVLALLVLRDLVHGVLLALLPLAEELLDLRDVHLRGRPGRTAHARPSGTLPCAAPCPQRVTWTRQARRSPAVARRNPRAPQEECKGPAEQAARHRPRDAHSRSHGLRAAPARPPAMRRGPEPRPALPCPRGGRGAIPGAVAGAKSSNGAFRRARCRGPTPPATPEPPEPPSLTISAPLPQRLHRQVLGKRARESRAEGPRRQACPTPETPVAAQHRETVPGGCPMRISGALAVGLSSMRAVAATISWNKPLFAPLADREKVSVKQALLRLATRSGRPPCQFPGYRREDVRPRGPRTRRGCAAAAGSGPPGDPSGRSPRPQRLGPREGRHVHRDPRPGRHRQRREPGARPEVHQCHQVGPGPGGD